MKVVNLNNVAYSDEYKKLNLKYEGLFTDENKNESEEIMLSDRLIIAKTSYTGAIDNLNLNGNKCVLSDNEGGVIHSWRNFDDNCDFYTLIEHKDGNTYIVYRQDLYGYTVFDLNNKAEYQYYPQCVLDGYEYFIWTDVHYNPLNNLLAVTGCIWGAPWSTLVVDFENPMADPKFQMDINDITNEGYDKYDDIDFVRWNGDELILSCYNVEKKLKEEVIFATTFLNK